MCALARMATPADPPGCVAALAQTTGCDCSWASPKNKAPLQGLAKAGTKAQMGCPASGADRAGCLAATSGGVVCHNDKRSGDKLMYCPTCFGHRPSSGTSCLCRAGRRALRSASPRRDVV